MKMKPKPKAYGTLESPPEKSDGWDGMVLAYSRETRKWAEVKVEDAESTLYPLWSPVPIAGGKDE